MASNDRLGLQGSPGRLGASERSSPSSRHEYFDGEIPPALSPLDAFAAQGRLLARQFDESRKSGRRLSRIPPASVARSLSRPRPGYFRSPSSEGPREHPRTPLSPAFPFPSHSNIEVEEPKFRPKSQHPRLSGLPTDYDGGDSKPWEKLGMGSRSASGEHIAGIPDEEVGQKGDRGNTATGSRTQNLIGIGVTNLRKGPTNDPPLRTASNTLAPPIYLPRSTSSPGLAHLESSDDDYYTSSTAGSTFSKPRKLSSSSGMSMPHSPMSTFTRPHPRSPSPASERSGTPHVLQRPSFNFSRPLSRSSTSISLPSPPTSEMKTTESQPRAMTRENRPAPITLAERSPLATQDAEEPPPSATYTYAKFNLPRGREVARDSVVFSGLKTPHFEWKEPLFEPPPQPTADRKSSERPVSPPAPAQIPLPTPTPEKPKASSAKASPARSPKPSEQSPPAPGRHSFDNSTREILALSSPSFNSSVKPGSIKEDDAKSTSAHSGSTIRPHTSHKETKSDTGSEKLTAEEYVAKGIACHENGSLKESTYYLRLAALQNHPTGMLMYALACRHGWGMRPNQQEGVEWLRKAVNSVADITQEVNTADLQLKAKARQEQKARQAQFALSIYELGVSHLNGWGVDQDKILARRCFEIAGHWGDIDALAEAGYCYAEGIGCKKDLKKAAKYYRMAEAKGMSMVGNSWYVFSSSYNGRSGLLK